MKEPTYQSLDELYDSYSFNQLGIVQNLDNTMQATVSIVQRNCLVYKFSNGSFLYCKKRGDGICIGFGWAAKLIKKHPILVGAFDEHMKVVSKIYLDSPDMIVSKGVNDLIVLMSQLD